MAESVIKKQFHYPKGNANQKIVDLLNKSNILSQLVTQDGLYLIRIVPKTSASISTVTLQQGSANVFNVMTGSGGQNGFSYVWLNTSNYKVVFDNISNVDSAYIYA